MRKYGVLLLLLLVVWVGYWAVGSELLKSQVKAALSEPRMQALMPRTPEVEVAGFPSRFDLTLHQPAFEDPTRGLAWQAEAVKFTAMTWKPWHILAALPPVQELTLRGQKIALNSEEFRASLRAKPLLDLPLAEGRIFLRAGALQSDAGWTLGLDHLSIGLREGPLPVEGAASYELGLNLENAALDPAWLARIAAVTLPIMPETPLPATISHARLNANLPLTAQLNRHSGATRPQPLGLNLESFALEWGDLKISAAGKISPDAAGYAEGEIRLTVEAWQHLPVLLVAADILPARFAPTLGNMLAAIAKPAPAAPGTLTEAGAEAKASSIVTMPLVLKAGQMSFGPLPLGEAPKLRP